MVQELLKSGRGNAIKSDDLLELLDVDRRSFYSMVHKERKAGAVIIGDNAGYYLPRERAEVEAYLRRAENRAKHDLEATKAARRLLRKMKGQSELFPAKKTPSDSPESQTTDTP